MKRKPHWCCATCRTRFTLDPEIERVWLVPRSTARWIAYCSVACRESHEVEVALVYAVGKARAEIDVLDAKGRWNRLSAYALHVRMAPHGVWYLVRDWNKPR